MTHLSTLGAFRAVSNCNYAFLSPFSVLSTKLFFAVFFLIVQVILTGDLQSLKFFTKPALNEHNSFYLSMFVLKRFNYSIGSAQRIKETLHLNMRYQVNKPLLDPDFKEPANRLCQKNWIRKRA
jgi:hypothetical protein